MKGSLNNEPRRTLRELIARHGPGLCSDARRCEGLLRDLCGEHRREINILVGALRERVPLDLLAARNSVPVNLLLTRLAKRLEDQLALTKEASRWAVDTWALALGVVSDAELEAVEGQRDEAAAPHPEATPRPSPPPPPPTQTGRPPAHQPPASRAARTGPAVWLTDPTTTATAVVASARLGRPGTRGRGPTATPPPRSAAGRRPRPGARRAGR